MDIRVDSSFISRVEYAPVPEDWKDAVGTGVGFLLVTIRGLRYAYLAPKWVPGLFAASTQAGRSVGRLYNRIVKNHLQVVPLS